MPFLKQRSLRRCHWPTLHMTSVPAKSVTKRTSTTIHHLSMFRFQRQFQMVPNCNKFTTEPMILPARPSASARRCERQIPKVRKPSSVSARLNGPDLCSLMRGSGPLGFITASAEIELTPAREAEESAKLAGSYLNEVPRPALKLEDRARGTESPPA